MQRTLQPLLVEFISTKWKFFVPTQHIMDNVLMQHELIMWHKES